MPLPLPLLDATFYLYNDVHLLLGGSDSLGPPPCRDLALVQLVDLSCGTATQSQATRLFSLVFFYT
jgi:hypothetical protein